MDFKKIVAATDFSEASLTAMETAFKLGSESGATLYLLHVLELPVAASEAVAVFHPSLEEFRKGAAHRLESVIPKHREEGANIKRLVLNKDRSAAHTIADFARQENVDLIVVGTHGRTGITRILMGSTAESLLNEAPCQVLVVKQKTEQSQYQPVGASGDE